MRGASLKPSHCCRAVVLKEVKPSCPAMAGLIHIAHTLATPPTWARSRCGAAARRGLSLLEILISMFVLLFGLMGVATMAVGLLPTYRQVGVLAPLRLDAEARVCEGYPPLVQEGDGLAHAVSGSLSPR